MNDIAPITPSDADRKAADNAQELAKQLASAHLPQLISIAVEKALDPTATIKNVLDTADFAYRLSGMAKKQDDKVAGPGFNLVINIPQIGSDTARTIEIGSSGAVETKKEEADSIDALLESLPDFIKNIEPENSSFSENDLLLDFEDDA